MKDLDTNIKEAVEILSTICQQNECETCPLHLHFGNGCCMLNDCKPYTWDMLIEEDKGGRENVER